nr:hypothetical protein [Geodermatophilaceae bacterium]
MRAVLVVLVGVLPASPTKNRLLNALGHRIDPSARIHPVLLWRIGLMEFAPGVTLWSLSRFRGLRRMTLGRDVLIMRFNHIYAEPITADMLVADSDAVGVLSIADKSMLNLNHTIDCTGGFFMGTWSGMGGREVFVSTHEFDPAVGRVTVAPSWLGSNSMVAARTSLSTGAVVPDRCALGMGGVMMPGADTQETLYGGVPARPVRDIADWTVMQ